MSSPALAQPLVNSTTISGSTAFGTFGSNTTTGNTIVVFSFFSGNPLATVSGVAVNAGTAAFVKILAIPGISNSIPSVEVWAAPNITGGTTPRVTATYSSAPAANSADLIFFELNGTPANLTPDGIPVGTGNITAATSMSAPAISTTQNGDIIFAAFATGSTVTAGQSQWNNTVSQHLGCSVEYLQVQTAQTGLTPTSTQQNSLAYGALTLGLASSTAVPIVPVIASQNGMTSLVFQDEFVTPADIGFGTDGHRWNAGLFFETTPPSSCFTNNLSIQTITAQFPETTTSATFAIPAQNTAVQVSLNASGYTPAVNDLVLITDGTHTLAADVTVTSPFTVNSRTYPGNSTSGTMGSGANVSLCSNVNLCTQQQDGLGGINFVGGYYEALINLTDFGAFWLFNAANREGTPGLAGNPFTWNNEIDIIEGDPGNSFLSNATTTVHKSTNNIGVTDAQNSNNNNATGTVLMNTWNKFSMLWTQSTITWYFNDVQICTAPAYTSTYKYATLIFDASKNGVNGSKSTVIPPNIQIDWVRVWQKPIVDQGATISVVNTTKSQVATASNAFSVGTPTKNNALIVFNYGSDNGSPSVTDTNNNNYYTIPLQATDNTVTHRMNCYYCINNATAANTITLAAASATYLNTFVYEVNFGTNNIPMLDQAFGVTNQSGTAMNSGSTFTTVNPHEIVFGFFGAASAITAGQAGFTSTISTDTFAMAQYKLLTATGTQSTTGTQTSASAYMGGTVSFYALNQPSMAITVPQFPTMVTATATQTPAQTFAGAVTAGNTIFAFVSWDSSSGSVTQVRDSVNGAVNYTALSPVFQGSAESMQLFYFPNSAAGTPTVTATLDASHNGASVDCIEVAGLTSSPLIDLYSTFNGTSGTTMTSGNITTKYPIEILIGGCRSNGQNTTAGGAGWTVQTSFRTGIQYLITSSAGIYASAFTQSGSAGFIDGIWAITFPGQTPVVQGGVGGSLIGANDFWGGGFS